MRENFIRNCSGRAFPLVLFVALLSACSLPPLEEGGGDLTYVDPGEIIIIDEKGGEFTPEPGIDTTGGQPTTTGGGLQDIGDDDGLIIIGDEEDILEQPIKPDIPPDRVKDIDKIKTEEYVSPDELTVTPEKSLQIWTDMRNHSNINYQALGTHPTVSKDGDLLSFASNMNSKNYQIYVRKINSAISNFVSITSGASDSLFPEISPDGTKIVFCNNKNGNYDIYVAGIDNPVSQMQLTFTDTDEISPSWSPDGTKVVFSFKNTFNVWQLAIVDVATRVVSYLGPGMFPKWGPNEKDQWIVYQAQPTTYKRTWGIWIVRPDGSMLQQIVSDPEDKYVAFNPNWSPDGNWLVYCKSPQQVFNKEYVRLSENIVADLYIIRKDGTMETHLTETLLPEWYPSWSGKTIVSDDGVKVTNDRIFFVSYKDRFQNIFSVKPPMIP